MADWDLWLRGTGAVILLLFYLSNIVTGWRATTASEQLASQHRFGWVSTLKVSFLYFLRPEIYNPSTMKIKERKKVFDNLRVYSPYISMTGAFFMFTTHLFWFISEAWKTQEFVIPFLFSHYLMSIAIHYFHFKAEMNLTYNGRESENESVNCIH